MRVLIIGGTGTLGKATINYIQEKHPIWQITSLSREELKIQKLKPIYPKVKFVVGDIRDYDSIERHIRHKDIIFHFAAMKHVDMCEHNPEECITSNLIGTMNVKRAIENSVCRYAIFCSTDKAVLPINIYGYCKGASEKLWFSGNASGDIRFSVFRWGNVLNSRGSVVGLFANQLSERRMIGITHPKMTRFWIHIDDVAKFMVDNYNKASITEAMIPEMKAASVLDVASAVAKVVEVDEYEIEYTGIRAGEKIHEVLRSRHDECLRSDTAKHYNFNELCKLVERCL